MENEIAATKYLNPEIVYEGPLGRLYVYWDEYRGKRYLHIRYWYQNKSTGDWYPGAKGISIPAKWAEETVEAMVRAIEADVKEQGRASEVSGRDIAVGSAS